MDKNISKHTGFKKPTKEEWVKEKVHQNIGACRVKPGRIIFEIDGARRNC